MCFAWKKLKIPAQCLPKGVSTYSESQHGFVKGKSYLTNLIFFTERMVSHRNKLSVEVVELSSLSVSKKHVKCATWGYGLEEIMVVLG